MPEISIIVPVYNTEKYLKKCFDSILAQTFTDFELLIVDDGSTDKSPEICDVYVAKDSRVKVIHKKNGGVSSARNAGLENAFGNYIGFVDSDDFIEPDMYEVLYKDLTKYNADIAICGIKGFYKTGQYIPNNLGEFAVYNTESALKNVLNGRITAGSTNKIYKKELFNGIKYPESKIYEDVFITPKLISKAKVVVCNPEAKYYYFHRSKSITTSDFSIKNFDVVDGYKEHLKMVKDRFPNLIKEAEYRCFIGYFEVLDNMVCSKKMNYKDEYKKVVNLIKKNIFKILFNPNFSKNRKLATIVLYFSDKLYKKIKIRIVNRYYQPFDS